MADQYLLSTSSYIVFIITNQLIYYLLPVISFTYPRTGNLRDTDTPDIRVYDNLVGPRLGLSASIIGQVRDSVPANGILLPLRASHDERLDAGRFTATWDRERSDLIARLESCPTGEDLGEVYRQTLMFSSMSGFDRAPPEFETGYIAWRGLFSMPVPSNIDVSSSSGTWHNYQGQDDLNPTSCTKVQRSY